MRLRAISGRKTANAASALAGPLPLPMNETSRRDSTAHSVERAFAILDQLRDSAGAMSVSHLARSTELSTTTVHRLLATLRKCEAVDQEPESRKYRLSLKMLLYGKAALDRYEWRTQVHTALGELARNVGETAFMGTLDHFELVYIDHVDSLDHELRISPQIGRRQDAHTTAMGKVLLAHHKRDAVERYLLETPLPRRTRYSLTDPQVLRNELDKVRAAGYATDQQESEIGISCVAVPVYRADGSVMVAISVSGPNERLQLMGLETTLKDMVKATASRISEQLAF